MAIAILIIIAVGWLIWFCYKNNQHSMAAAPPSTDIKIRITYPYNNDYIKMEVVSHQDYIRFDIAGMNYRNNLNNCLGEFDGWLIAEPDNPHDSSAVKVVHANGQHIGYVPRNYDGDSVKYYKHFPCACHGYIARGERGYYGVCAVNT